MLARLSNATTPFAAAAIVGGAAISLTLVRLRISAVDPAWWRWRDDAVITLSHARNWTDGAGVGISPGGDRLEAFSTPLQFVLSVVFYSLGGDGYRALLNLQVWLCVAGLGALSGATAYTVARSLNASPIHASAAALFTSGIVAIGTAWPWTSVGWLVSGMENSLVVFLGSMLVLLLAWPVASRGNTFAVVLVLSAIGVSRVEFIALIPPLLLTAAYCQAMKAKVRSRRNTFLVVLIGSGISVASTHLFRFLYFGVNGQRDLLVGGQFISLCADR